MRRDPIRGPAILRSMDQLFDSPEERPRAESASPPADGPLAARMRPHTLEEYVGQGHLLGEGSALRTSLEAGRPHSMVLYGPPGTGKTTLARLAADRADAAFEELSAVQAGRAEVREVIARARERRRAQQRRTIFFLDEIHRFNKAQQDALLPAVEEGLRHADRGDDREPVLRGQLGAALAHAGLRAAGALRRGRRAAAAPRGRARRDPARRRPRRGGGVPRRALRRRRAHRARTRSSWPRPPRPARRSRSPRPRTRCSARPSSTTRAATSTTTTSRPGSSRRAARTPTPRSTTSRRCSRAARTRASSPGGW